MIRNKTVLAWAVLLCAGQERRGLEMALKEGKAGQSCCLQTLWDALLSEDAGMEVRAGPPWAVSQGVG